MVPRGPGDFGLAFTALLTAAGTNPDGIRRALPGVVSRSVLYDWKEGRHLPSDTGPLVQVVELCLGRAGPGADLRGAPGDVAGWLELLAEAKQTRDTHAERRRPPDRPAPAQPEHADPGAGPGASQGWPVEQWGPVRLGVHRAIGGGPLPPYVHRAHDHVLYAVLNPKVAANRLVVLRGGSSTGKSRAAYEAVRAQMPRAQLLYPQTAAALEELLEHGVPGRSVLWLNELRHYADDPGGQRVLGKLSSLMVGRDHQVVVTSVWPDHWAAYTADHHAGPGTADPVRASRALLTSLPDLSGVSPRDVDAASGGVIDVPEAFTDDDLTRARRHGGPLLNEAIDAAERGGSPGQVAQYLAGVPALLAHYQGPGADPYGHALITAAVDAVRLGHHPLLSPELLQYAAVGYLHDRARALSEEAWQQTLSRAWDYATRTLKGTVRALEPVPPAYGVGVAGYRLADYLDQHGRATRHAHPVPAALWDALVSFAPHEQLAPLAEQARNRGLYRHAARMAGRAAQHGAVWAMHRLADEAGRLGDGVCATAWLRRAVETGDSHAMTRLARTVLAQDPAEAEKWLRAAAQAGSGFALDELIKLLDQTDRQSEAEHLLTVSMAGGNTRALMRLVRRLKRAGNHGQAMTLLREATANGNLRARSALVCALVYDGRIDEAETLLPISAYDGYDMDLYDLTKDLFNTGRHVEAEAWLRRLIRDGDIWARYMMVRGLDEHDRRSEAEEWLRSIADTGRIEAMSELAGRLDAEGRAEEAELWHRRSASTRHERRDQSLYWLSMRLDDQGRHEEAMDYRQQAIDAVNCDRMALLGFPGWLTERFGAHEAERVLQTLANMGNWRAAFFLAGRLEERGRYDRAEGVLRPAAEAGDHLAMSALGRLLRDHSDRYGEAESWLRRSVEAGGAKVGDMTELAQLLTNDGREDEARRLQRFGLEPGGTTADPWSPTRTD